MALTFGIEDKGILPDRMIAALAADGGILPATEFVPDQIQPCLLYTSPFTLEGLI